MDRLKADGKRLFNTSAFDLNTCFVQSSAFSLQPKYLSTIFTPALPGFCTVYSPSLRLEQACLKTWVCIDLDITNIFLLVGELYFVDLMSIPGALRTLVSISSRVESCEQLTSELLSKKHLLWLFSAFNARGLWRRMEEAGETCTINDRKVEGRLTGIAVI